MRLTGAETDATTLGSHEPRLLRPIVAVSDGTGTRTFESRHLQQNCEAVFEDNGNEFVASNKRAGQK